MSFLDDIPREISDALAADFRDAVVHVPTVTSDDEGGFPVTWSDVPVKALRVEYDRAYAARSGIPDSDVSIIVLRHGVNLSIGLDHEITIGGRRHAVVRTMTDPADATWTVQARPLG